MCKDLSTCLHKIILYILQINYYFTILVLNKALEILCDSKTNLLYKAIYKYRPQSLEKDPFIELSELEKDLILNEQKIKESFNNSNFFYINPHNYNIYTNSAQASFTNPYYSGRNYSSSNAYLTNPHYSGRNYYFSNAYFTNPHIFGRNNTASYTAFTNNFGGSSTHPTESNANSEQYGRNTTTSRTNPEQFGTNSTNSTASRSNSEQYGRSTTYNGSHTNSHNFSKYSTTPNAFHTNPDNCASNKSYKNTGWNTILFSFILFIIGLIVYIIKRDSLINQKQYLYERVCRKEPSNYVHHNVRENFLTSGWLDYELKGRIARNTEFQNEQLTQPIKYSLTSIKQKNKKNNFQILQQNERFSLNHQKQHITNLEYLYNQKKKKTATTRPIKWNTDLQIHHHEEREHYSLTRTDDFNVLLYTGPPIGVPFYVLPAINFEWDESLNSRMTVFEAVYKKGSPQRAEIENRIVAEYTGRIAKLCEEQAARSMNMQIH